MKAARTIAMLVAVAALVTAAACGKKTPPVARPLPPPPTATPTTAPPRPETQAICVPVGDHVGDVSMSGLLVSRRRPLPSLFMT